MFILNYHISKNAISSIKDPKVKNITCNTNTGKIKVTVYSEADDEYIFEYDSNQICNFTSEEICILTFRIFTKFDSTQHKSLMFRNMIMDIIDDIIIGSKKEEYNSDNDSTK